MEYTIETFKQFIRDELPRDRSEQVILPTRWQEWKTELLEWFDREGIRLSHLQETEKISTARLAWKSDGSHLRLVD